MSRSDRVMRAVWSSPFTALVGLLASADGFYHQHGWQRWIAFGVSIFCGLGFITSGSKRWGSGK